MTREEIIDRLVGPSEGHMAKFHEMVEKGDVSGVTYNHLIALLLLELVELRARVAELEEGSGPPVTINLVAK